MGNYILRRLALMVPTLFGIMLINFLVVQAAPGGPVEQMIHRIQHADLSGSNPIAAQGGGQHYARGLPPEIIERIQAMYGFDKPAHERFWIMLKNYAVFDFGESFYRNASVLDLIIEKLPVSVSLGLWSTLLIYLISIPLGIRKAISHGSRFDVLSSSIVSMLYAIPGFLLGILLIVVFAGGTYLDWFPLRGLTSNNFDELSLLGKIRDYFWHLALPLTAYTIGGFATLTMLTKNSFLDEINKQYVVTAQAKGLSKSQVLYRHVPRELIERIQAEGELTIEAWLTPAKAQQSGPARIITLSKDSSQRNFTLGQDGDRFDFRLRTTKTDLNGLPSLSTPRIVKTDKLHVVVTFDQQGVCRCFVNAKQVAEKQIGGTLTRRLTALGHEVKVANSRGPETLSELAAETGARAVTVREAVRGVGLIVVTIPQARVQDLPEDLFAEVPDDVVVVDTGNYYPRHRDGRIKEIEAGMTESGWVEHRLGRPVVKAFNNIGAQSLLENGRPAGDPDRIALPVAGHRQADKDLLLEIIDRLGFDGIDAGRLDDSWRQQPGTPVRQRLEGGEEDVVGDHPDDQATVRHAEPHLLVEPLRREGGGDLARDRVQAIQLGGRRLQRGRGDVRGVVPDEWDEDVARRIGAAFAELVWQESGATAVVTAHDMRDSSPELSRAFADGVRSHGVDVTMIGLCSPDGL